MRLIAVTYTDDQFGPMWPEAREVTTLFDVIKAQSESSYVLYKTDLSINKALNICGYADYNDDLSEHGIHYVYEEPDNSSWEEDELNERIEAAKILMKLKANDGTFDFHDLPADNYVSLKSCNMLTSFYPWAVGDSYTADMKRYEELRAQQEQQCPPRKELHELTEEEYNTLKNVGILFETYKSATGVYKNDTALTRVVKLYAHGCRESSYETGQELGLTGDALRRFAYAAEEVELEVEVDLNTGDSKIISVDGRKLCDG